MRPSLAYQELTRIARVPRRYHYRQNQAGVSSSREEACATKVEAKALRQLDGVANIVEWRGSGYFQGKRHEMGDHDVSDVPNTFNPDCAAI